MRFRFMLVPIIAAAVIPGAAMASETFLSVEEAQQLIFPGASFTPADITLSDADMERLRVTSDTTVFRAKVKLWKVSTGGWFFLDQVPGRDDRITYAVGLNADGSVKSMEVLICTGEYGQVRAAAWRRTFVGKRYHGAHQMKEFPNISGATLSAAHISQGVSRVLATYALFVAPKAG
jgi:hypothetical protein